MKIITKQNPTNPAFLPSVTESNPKLGPTLRSSMIFKGAGRAPALSKTASSFAVSIVKFPEITPEPAIIGSLMVGALNTLSSKTIARGLPVFCFVTSANILVPLGLKARGPYLYESSL